MLNRFLLLKKEIEKCDNKDKKDEKITDFIGSCIDIAYASFQIKNMETFYDRFGDFFYKLYKVEKDISIDPDWLKDNINSIELNAEQVGHLFNQLLDFKERKIARAGLLEEDGSIRETIKDSKLEKKIVFAKPETVLYEVISIHLMIIFLAFKNVSEIKEKNAIIDAFLKNIVQDPTEEFPDRQGWKNCVLVKEGKRKTNKKITKGNILKNISETLDVFFDKLKALYCKTEEKISFTVEESSSSLGLKR